MRYKVIIRRDVIFNESIMPCLKGNKDNLIIEDIQIEVENPHIERERGS